MTNRAAAALLLLAALLFAGCTPRPRGVVLFVGDGMGDAEITIARNYHVGAAGKLAIDRLPHTADATTYALREDPPHLPEYVGDSAAGATALATGHRTSNRRVATEVGTGRPLPTIAEEARDAGLATGIVTTCDLTDATPASFTSHSAHRGCRSASEMAACESTPNPRPIADQIIDGRFDIVMGGGAARFGDRLNRTSGQPLPVLQSAADLDRLHPDGPILGVFAPEDFETVWRGDPATPHPGSGPQTCVESGRPPEQPGLPAMTKFALERLKRNNRGFFLLVEGALIDKRAHDADPCGQIGETIEFDEAVALALRERDLLVIVVADHAHSSQAIWAPMGQFHSPGRYSRLQTREGAELVVNYGTTANGLKQSHTGTQVRVAAAGPGAERIQGLIGLTDIHTLITDALGLPAARRAQP